MIRPRISRQRLAPMRSSQPAIPPPRRAARSGAALALLPAVLLGALMQGGCRPAPPAAAEAIPVRIMRVEQQTLRLSLDYAGDIRAREEVLVYPKVAGKIAHKVREEGSRVQKGESIAYIDRDEVGFTYAPAPVESPLAGLVGRVYVDRGTSVSPQTPIALVVDNEAMELTLDVPEKFWALLKLGLSAELKVEAWPEETFQGQVTKISPVIDLETRTTPVTITLANPEGRLQSGMFARVRLIIEEHTAPVVIKEALLGKIPDAYVFLAQDGVARIRDVSLGIREGNRYEVTAGLQPGDLVVIMGQQRLQDGSAIKAEENAPGEVSY